MIKRNVVTAASLVVGMAISLIGYGSDATGTASVQGTQTQGTVLDHSSDRSPEGETRIVVDHTGREIEIPAEINRIVISSLLSLLSAYSLFEGSAEKLMGIHPSSMATAENLILPKVVPSIPGVNTDLFQGEELNIGELLNLKPGVVFYSVNSTEEYEKLAAAGIPAIGFSTSSWDSDCVAASRNWVKPLGGVLGREDKVAGITDYGHQVYDGIQTALNETGDIERPRVLILSNHTNGAIKTSGSNLLGQYWIESAGDINVAADLTGALGINTEQIYEWDPDIIYITNFSPYLPEGLYDNTIKGHDWSSMKAAKEGKVYKFPLGTYRWLPPAPDTPLVLRWLAQKNQPQLSVDVNMEQEIHTYHERFYSVALLDRDITQTFNLAGEMAGN